jgi:hypothetical protein
MEKTFPRPSTEEGSDAIGLYRCLSGLEWRIGHGKPQVEGHWHSLIEGFATSSLDFYELVKAGIARRQMRSMRSVDLPEPEAPITWRCRRRRSLGSLTAPSSHGASSRRGIPEARLQDAILFDPADTAFPVAWNILEPHSELERTLLSSDLVGIFRRFSTSWGDQMTSVLGNAVLVLLENPGSTLLDLREFLVDRQTRERLLGAVEDRYLLSYFRHEFQLAAGKSVGAILTRLMASCGARPCGKSSEPGRADSICAPSWTRGRYSLRACRKARSGRRTPLSSARFSSPSSNRLR